MPGDDTLDIGVMKKGNSRLVLKKGRIILRAHNPRSLDGDSNYRTAVSNIKVESFDVGDHDIVLWLTERTLEALHRLYVEIQEEIRK